MIHLKPGNTARNHGHGQKDSLAQYKKDSAVSRLETITIRTSSKAHNGFYAMGKFVNQTQTLLSVVVMIPTLDVVKFLVLALLFVTLASFTEAYPQQIRDFRPVPQPSSKRQAVQQAPAPSSGGAGNGRVKMQVYRGPSQPGKQSKTGGDSGSFAPWGFYVTQAEDGPGRR